MEHDVEFQIEGAQDTAPQRHIRVEATEGQDSIKIDAPESVALHLLTEFRQRQDMLNTRSMADAERLTAMRREMVSAMPQRSLVDTSH